MIRISNGIRIVMAFSLALLVEPVIADERDARHRHLAPGETAMIYGARGSDCDMAFPSEEQVRAKTVLLKDKVLVEDNSPISVLRFDPTLGKNGDGTQRSRSCGKNVPFVPVSFTVPEDASKGTTYRVIIFGDEVRAIVVGGE